MSRACTWLCGLMALAALGCDLVVEENQTTTLESGSFAGSSTPNAVLVRPQGTLVVAGAELSGRTRAIEAGDRLQAVGAAIVSNTATVRISAGMISGGNLLIFPQDPNTPAPELSPAEIFAGSQLQPALAAVDSLVQIDGGTLVSSGAFGVLPSFLSGAPAVWARGGELRIRGGTLRAAILDPARTLNPNVALAALDARVTISGGTFGGAVRLAGASARILGGELGSIELGRDDRGLSSARSGCTEIHGGAIGHLSF